MELREYLDILRRRWLSVVIIMLLTTLLTVASVSATTLITTKAYTATTRLLFAVAGDSPSSLAQGSSVVEKQMALYAEVATSPRVLDQVIEQLSLDTTSDQLADSIEASVPVDTVIIEVAVTNPDPRQAAGIANAVGTELVKAAGELTPAVRATTIAVAQVPTSPSSQLDRLRRLVH